MDNKQWHGGKGSKRRNSNEDLYANNWEKIFGKSKVRKKTPEHASTKMHKDKTKEVPRHYKYKNIEE